MTNRGKPTKPIISTEVEMVPIETLKAHPGNPRQGDIGAIIQSIEVNGFFGCVIAQYGTNRILAGHHKWEAARQCGLKQVPAMFLKVDDEAALRIMLVDNKANDNASYDDPKLIEALQALIQDTRTLEGSGFDESDLADLIANLEQDTEEVNFETTKKNKHIILVECKSAAELKRTMAKLVRLGLNVRMEE